MSGQPFWSLPASDVLEALGTSRQGLGTTDAEERVRRRPRAQTESARRRAVRMWLAQFTSPITLLLLFAAGLSAVLQDPTDTIIILAIILVSGFLGFWQEWNASDAIRRLLAVVTVKATVVRGGQPVDVPVEEVVPGDVVQLNAGDVIPADGLILECKDLFVNEGALTGESYPVEKSPGLGSPQTPLSQRTNVVFMGTHVVSGTAAAVIVATGPATEFGRVAERLRVRAPETEFERGVRRFGYLLMTTTLLLVIAIFGINVYLTRPVLESLLFALALAVGLTPQLLPAIISVNLSHGARRMARERVIVKRLAAIENFGSMDVLCTDKTGTLSTGTVRMRAALDPAGAESEWVARLASANASLQSGFTNPLDDAIRAFGSFDLSQVTKLDEVPYDFVRRRLSVLVRMDGTTRLITKGAVPSVLAVCAYADGADRPQPIGPQRDALERRFEQLSADGFRTLGVAYRDGGDAGITRDSERDLVFAGFLVLFDPPKPGIERALEALRGLGIRLKIVSGDNRYVAASMARAVGLAAPALLTGEDLRQMSDEALARRAREVDLFAEIEPNQKERVILALKKAGHVVGYLGDGINDATALHAADVGVSVDSAVDVAREAAEIVLLEKDLGVLAQGVREGRTTFANTLKYVFMATSANFGNMFSMAGASLFLPFLPLLPTQILLTNLLTDLPEMTIAGDAVDPELVQRPRRWDIGFIRRFMVTFGLVSSVFDFLTFAVLLLALHAGPLEFRTGWFVESVVSASLIVLVMRTRRSFHRSRPARALLWATAGVAGATVLLPFLPVGRVFGFVPLPGGFLAAVGGIMGLYILTAELVKRAFYAVVRF